MLKMEAGLYILVLFLDKKLFFFLFARLFNAPKMKQRKAYSEETTLQCNFE